MAEALRLFEDLVELPRVELGPVPAKAPAWGPFHVGYGYVCARSSLQVVIEEIRRGRGGVTARCSLGIEHRLNRERWLELEPRLLPREAQVLVNPFVSPTGAPVLLAGARVDLVPTFDVETCRRVVDDARIVRIIGVQSTVRDAVRRRDLSLTVNRWRAERACGHPDHRRRRSAAGRPYCGSCLLHVDVDPRSDRA